MQFLGLGTEDSKMEKARVVVLPVPYEATTSYGKGTRGGPSAIIHASAQVELFDEELEASPYKYGISTAKGIDFGEKKGEDAVSLIESAAGAIVEDGKFLVSLGGEHTITTGLVRAMRRKFPDLSVVHLDAHADMRAEYEYSGWSHACVMHRIHELGIPFTSIGIRSLSAEEFETIRPMRDRYFFAHEIAADGNWISKALEKIGDTVYLTLDVDVFDCSIIPATGTPEPGGLDWYQVTGFLKRLMLAKRVVGADVVELSPDAKIRASDFTVAKLVHKIIGLHLCSS